MIFGPPESNSLKKQNPLLKMQIPKGPSRPAPSKLLWERPSQVSFTGVVIKAKV
jgi:hypothetical protein